MDTCNQKLALNLVLNKSEYMFYATQHILFGLINRTLSIGKMNIYRHRGNGKLYTISHLILDINHLNRNASAGIYTVPYNWKGEQLKFLNNCTNMKHSIGIHITILTFLAGNALIKQQYDNPFRNSLILISCLTILIYYQRKRLFN